MKKKIAKAGYGRHRSSFHNLKFAGANLTGFSAFNNTYFGQKCKQCGSDYMKFADENGYCQRCQQKVEFIRREYPQYITAVQQEVSA
jgi:hypothetical protein